MVERRSEYVTSCTRPSSTAATKSLVASSVAGVWVPPFTAPETMKTTMTASSTYSRMLRQFGLPSPPSLEPPKGERLGLGPSLPGMKRRSRPCAPSRRPSFSSRLSSRS